MAIKTVGFAILYHILVITQVQTLETDLSKEIPRCLQTVGNSSKITDTDIIHCVQQFMWQTGNVVWSQFNITKKEEQFINSLIGTAHERKKRQVGATENINSQNNFPRNGFRIRREYRTLSDRERSDFHSAVNKMKMSGQYDIFSNLHRGTVVYSGHGGPNFLGWHRVYLVLFEEALRRINPTLSLPYWDSTLDFDMNNPVDSIIWSSPFLGNGDGFVTSGPFRNWMTAVGRLTRNIGTASRLLSKESIRPILSSCRTRDISEPTAQPRFSLEYLQGGPHVWVGGQMSGLNTAASDPAFFLHHAFVDLIWEMFRSRQERYCGTNPAADYPSTTGLHAAERTIDGMSSYRNIDGYSSYWTRFVYRYAPVPTCSTFRPFCGSPYLRCNVARQRCVSVARTGRADGAGTNLASIARARAEESTINIGPRFRAPPSEIRTQDAQIRLSRLGFSGSNMAFASGNPSSFASALRARAQEATINVGPRFAAPPPEPRTQDAQLGMSRGRF
ncbi:putative tyrosinase-like protein tyr-3 [Mercenaria mercenaria]|uniref:putative tyrosinase-like protein tyr-3 n=1 Tax=Mercenaria mercenaria TaxID=6596 RepID=UPI00234FAC48|nr:putative tyrosinase-like protein tyr-3 [Mercenaria mercenaria]